MRQIIAKYNGKCDECGGRIAKGSAILWARGYQAHAGCDSHAIEREDVERERRFMDQEVALGMARADHIRDTARFFGEEAAMAEELAWELKDPDPNY